MCRLGNVFAGENGDQLKTVHFTYLAGLAWKDHHRSKAQVPSPGTAFSDHFSHSTPGTPEQEADVFTLLP